MATETVTTIEEARDHISQMIHEHGKEAVEGHICTALNREDALVDSAMYVWVRDAGAAHGLRMLSPAQTIALVNTLNRGV